MPTAPRRTMAELFAMYALEPTIRDLYVEGDTDKHFWHWFLCRQLGLKVDVASIDTIDVPSSALAKFNKLHGQRGRVIVLALEFEEKFGPTAPHLTCIADSDFATIDGHAYHPACLFYTRWTSLELHFLTPESVERFFYTIHSTEVDGEAFVAAAMEVLGAVFAVRAANADLGWNMAHLDFDKFVDLSAYGLIFDRERYITAYLNKNRRLKQSAMFRTAVQSALARFRQDPRYQAHGHDLLTLLVWYLLEQHAVHRTNAPTARALFACVDVQDLKKDMFFSSVILKLTNI
jgi:hypothetical protein